MATLAPARQRHRGRALGALLFTAFVICSQQGAASPQSEKLIEEGIELRRAGRDSVAVRKLEAAYGLDPTPRAAAQLGLCLQALGRWSEADGKLAEAISAGNDPWIRKNRSTLKDSLEIVKTHVARVEVLGEPEGATVIVNGKPVGQLPLAEAVPVNEGLVDVEVKASGFASEQKSLTLQGAAYQRLVVRLKPSAPLTQAPPAIAPQFEGPAPAPTVGETLTENSPSKPLLQSPWFWGAVAVVVAGGVVAALVLSKSDPTSPSFNDSGDF